ncbi:hypothetical protein EV687_3042 [Corticibacter populi]|nr:hypothetical protein EV687_3042 [Corticibacter populi]
MREGAIVPEARERSLSLWQHWLPESGLSAMVGTLRIPCTSGTDQACGGMNLRMHGVSHCCQNLFTIFSWATQGVKNAVGNAARCIFDLLPFGLLWQARAAV